MHAVLESALIPSTKQLQPRSAILQACKVPNSPAFLYMLLPIPGCCLVCLFFIAKHATVTTACSCMSHSLIDERRGKKGWAKSGCRGSRSFCWPQKSFRC